MAETEIVTNPQPTPEDRIEGELNRYKAELLPGSVPHLVKAWSNLGHLDAPALAEEVHRRLEGPMGRNFKNPEYVPPKLENGAAPSPVRAALARHADELRPGAVEELTAAWSVGLSYKGPAAIAGEVTRRLGLLENDHYLAVGRALTQDQQRVASLLSRHFTDAIDWTAAKKMARDHGLNLAAESDQSLVKRVASCLMVEPFAARFGARAIHHGDPRTELDPKLSAARPGWRQTPAAPAQPARNPQGQFSRPPARGGRKPGLGSF